ncbi:MAG: TrmB family transcriptional regulator [Candidatus Levyibacteriota bacterium]
MESIITYLEQLGLSEIEAKLYLTLLQTGPMSIRDLAQTVEIKRTTAYFYVDQLLDKGLLMKLVRGSKKLVAAEDYKALEMLVGKKVAAAKEMQTNLDDIITLITTSLPQKRDEGEAEITYSKGNQALKRLYEEALKGKELRVYANLEELEDLFKANNFLQEYQVYEKALLKNKYLKIYEIIANTPGSIENFNIDQTAKTERYFYKYMPADAGVTAPGILMYDNTVAIVNGKENFSVVVLRSVDYYINSVRLFDFIWKVLPKI